MLDTIFSSQTGLLGFSRGLNSISNNVANLNSPGYKARGLAFSDLFYRFESGGDAGRDQSPVLVGQGLNVTSSFGSHVVRPSDARLIVVEEKSWRDNILKVVSRVDHALTNVAEVHHLFRSRICGANLSFS